MNKEEVEKIFNDSDVLFEFTKKYSMIAEMPKYEDDVKEEQKKAIEDFLVIIRKNVKTENNSFGDDPFEIIEKRFLVEGDYDFKPINKTKNSADKQKELNESEQAVGEQVDEANQKTVDALNFDF